MSTLYTINQSRPAPLPFRLRMPDGSTRTDPATFTAAEIEAAGYVEAPPKPAHDDAIEAPATWVAGEWAVRKLTAEELAARARKVWKNGAAFLAEFDIQKQLPLIALSPDPTIASLRLLLATWAGEVWSDDPRVVAGLDALVTAKIITAEERAAKFTKG